MVGTRYRILGPLEVWNERRWVAPTAPLQRVLLAVLLCHRNSMVSFDRLQDELWAGRPPATARQLLHGYVFRLRRLLADPNGTRLATRPAGYQLAVGPGELDADQFTALTERGRQALRAGSFGEAAGRLGEALALWRGAVLAEISGSPSVDAERLRLEGRRLIAAECQAQAELACGRHREIVPELAPLVAENPLQEELHRCLMLALYRSGRQAEALEAYRALRRRLVDELGIEPSPELRQLHHQMLSADPSLAPPEADDARPTPEPVPGAADQSDPVRPWQLPPDVTTFTGRAGELAQIDKILTAAASGPAAIAVYGPAGVGKSALALHAAHRLAEQFPDGVLYADLQGATVALRPVPPHRVLLRFLRALGGPSNPRPVGVDEASAMVRSLLATRRVLLILDNAANAAQVRPLLPAGGGCGVLVTSREMLAALDSATHVQVPALPPDQAVALLAEVAGEQRVSAEPDAAAVLARQCEYLPLALRIAGARLAARPGWPVRALADRLADERGRLDELVVGDLAVRSSFQVSYRALVERPATAEPVVARVFRLLGLLNSRDLSTGVVAALAGLPWSRADAALERLVDMQLVSSPTPGRYNAHDLLRLFAREVAARDESPADRGAAVRRALECYLATARRATSLLFPTESRTEGRQDGALPLATGGEALRWLELERQNLLEVAGQAASERATAAMAIQLGSVLFRFLDYHGYWQELVELNHVVLAAAERVGDRAGLAQAHNDLGAAYTRLRQYESALRYLESSLAIRRELADLPAIGATVNVLGVVHRNLNQLDDAVACFEESLAIARSLGDRRGEARRLDNLGQVSLSLQQYERTIDYQQQSLAIAREIEDRHLEGLILANLADTTERAGDCQRALSLAQAGLAICRELGNAPGQALAHRVCGNASRALGQQRPAWEHWRAALVLYERVGSPLADEMRTLLARSAAD